MDHPKFTVQQMDIPTCEIDGCSSWQQFEIGRDGLIETVVCSYHIERGINELTKKLKEDQESATIR